jgi:hypothetical protein
MRIASMLLGVLFILSSASAINVNEAANWSEVVEQPVCAESESGLQQAPPTRFETYITPWDGHIAMREEQSIIVGELVVDCGPNAPGPPVFEFVPPAPSFARIVAVPCICQNQARAKVIVFPRRGDAGKYNIFMWAGSCGGVGQHHNFTLKVKKAQQD